MKTNLDTLLLYPSLCVILFHFNRYSNKSILRCSRKNLLEDVLQTPKHFWKLWTKSLLHQLIMKIILHAYSLQSAKFVSSYYTYWTALPFVVFLRN